MFLRDVITQLRKELPKNSDKFSEKVDISTITYAAGVVTVVTSSAHGLDTGDVCTIVDSKQKTPISSIVTTDFIATVTTSIPHDQTLDYQSIADQPEITIGGADVSEYNGDWALNTVPNRNTFTIELTENPDDATIGYILENSVGGFSGIKTVTKVNDTTFTFTTSKELASEGFGGYVHYDLRISGGVSLDVCKLAYSKQLSNNWWAFVTPIATNASKNRQTDNDSTYSPTKGDEYRQKLVSGFEVYFFVPSRSDIAGRASYDECIQESKYIFKSLLGFNLPNPYSIDDFSSIIFESHDAEEFTGAWYIHRFTFNITNEIIIDDINTTSDDVAFRDINYDIVNSFDTIIADNSLKTDQE
ncbi:MAG: hypothetical protein JSU91_01885 [Thermoplasmatales archaeon]|nr:MAG: hypothetical protein JSU91_01885 [Thermoplasmatales archaeon]